VLIQALRQLDDLPWTCRIVGSKTLDAAVAEELVVQIAETGLGDRVQLPGEVEDVGPEFARAGIFALASRYEGYGMVFAEALASGLPIAACAVGAVPDVVPKQAGFLVPPDDPPALARALRRLLTEPETRTAMAKAAAEAGAGLPSWRDTATILAGFLETRP
jgi:glycosyltransferase involved in cell wall biosynthesis